MSTARERAEQSAKARVVTRRPITLGQQNYLAVLLNDMGVTSAVGRKNYLSAETGRAVFGVPDLTAAEASEIISSLRQQLNNCKDVESRKRYDDVDSYFRG